MHHVRPCQTNSHEGLFVQRDALCEGCSRVNSWIAGGGGDKSNGTQGATASRRKARHSSVQMARSSQCYPHVTQGKPSPNIAESASPVPMTVQSEGLCALPEAFERVVIGDDEREMTGSGGVFWADEGIVIHGKAQEQKLRYEPSRPSRFSSNRGDGGVEHRLSGLFSLLGDRGGGMRKHRAAVKKRVRFTPNIEVVYFKKNWPTWKVSREYKEHL